MSYEEDFIDFVESLADNEFTDDDNFTLGQFCFDLVTDQVFVESDDPIGFVINFLPYGHIGDVAAELLDGWFELADQIVFEMDIDDLVVM